MAGRPQGEEATEIVKVLREVGAPAPAGMTSEEVARRLQLSRAAASRHLSRLADRGEVRVVDRRQVPGVDRPVHVYRAVEVDLMPSGTLMESLNRAIALRRAIREAG